MLEICTERTYEGEPAMKLEAFAAGGRDRVEIPVVIERKGFEFVVHSKIPCGDGGISLGQAVMGAHLLNNKGLEILWM